MAHQAWPEFPASAVAKSIAPGSRVQDVGSANGTSAATTFVFTIPARVATASGNSVTLIAAGTNGNATLQSVTDSKGNNWRIDASHGAGAAFGAQLAIASCLLEQALVAGDRVTLTWSQATVPALLATEWRGTLMLDSSVAAYGTATTVSAGTTPSAATPPGSVVIGAAAVTADSSFTPASGGEALPRAVSSGRVIAVRAAWRPATARGGQSMPATIGSGSWDAITLAYRAGLAWEATFAGGDRSEWTTWDHGTLTGTTAVVSYTSANLPAPPSGHANVLSCSLSPTEVTNGRIHAKVYKGWDVTPTWPDDAGRPHVPLVRGDELGTYSAWYYIPFTYQMAPGVTGPVNIFQFKEDYDDGGYNSDAQSTMNLWNAETLKAWPMPNTPSDPGAYDFGLRSDHPLLAVGLWHEPDPVPRGTHQPVAMPAPLGRWFQIAARLFPGDRVEYWVDGRLLDTWYDDEYPVGIRYARAMGWTFGVGHYGSNVGKLWIADASFVPGPASLGAASPA